jgi:DNA polymerase alpha-associated DNA helicase A
MSAHLCMDLWTDCSLKLANSVTFDRMERTLRHVRKIVVPETTSSGPSSSAVPNVTLVNTLLGLEEPQWHDEVPAPFSQSEEESGEGGTDNEIKWFGEALNDSQKEAIRFCLKAQTLGCIHGPPGVSGMILDR